LEVRSGLHAGEVEGQARDLSGIVVHTGARVAAQANPGEILVSGTVRDLVAGSGFRFEDRGVHTLKGVPGEWRLHAVESLPSGAPSSEGRRWIPELGRWHIQLIAAVVGLLVVAGAIRVATRDASRIDPQDAVAAGAAPAIAVLPFRVADPSLAVWREGIVDLLTANLDGVGGLRAIDSRTVLAQWHEGVPEGQVPDLRTTLKIASEAGGSYAVVGSAVTIGPNVRLSADVYELARGRAIGAARAEGPPDSLYPLVDRLSLEVLRAILKEDADKLPAVPDLTSLTTASFPALKAYLEGEALYRTAQFENAVAAYRRAVAADSTFALAWLRLAEAGWWFMPNSEIVDEVDRALALSDRLSQRETMLAQATRAFLLSDRLRTRQLVRQFLNSYPDDPELWSLLAMSYGDQFYDPDVPGDPADGERALLRAVRLDPTFAPYRIHLLYRSFWEADREQVAEQLAALDRLAQQDDERVKAARLAYALAWGDSASHAQTWATLDTLDVELLRETSKLLNNGRFLSINEALLRQPQADLDTGRFCRTCLAGILVWEGKFQEEIRLLEDPMMPGGTRRHAAYNLYSYGATLPEPLERDLAFGAADTNTTEWVAGRSWFIKGAYAADRGRWPDHTRAVQSFREGVRQFGGDSIDMRASGGAAKALEGYGLWKRGRPQEALPLLIAGQSDMVGPSVQAVPNMIVRRWIGLLFLELGRPAEAIPYLQTLWPGGIIRDPFMAYEMGRAYSELGENRKAIEAYQEALLAWRDADPVLKPRIEAARREIARLGGTAE
jgi:serine/threonine-protein kinase